MKLVHFLLLTFSLINPVLGQFSFEHRCSDGISRLGPIAEPKKFKYVKYDGGGYYEVISGKATAYVECGKKIEILINEVVSSSGDIYYGSYDRYTGQWAEIYVDFDSSGPESATRVYIILDDLRKLSSKPDDPKRLFSYRVSAELGKQSEFHKREDSYFLPFLVVGLVIIAFLVIRNLAAGGRSSYSGGPHTGCSSNSSQSSATISASYDGNSTSEKKSAPKDPNEGYTVTGYDAYGPSERRDMFGLTTQRKNDLGHWENV